MSTFDTTVESFTPLDCAQNHQFSFVHAKCRTPAQNDQQCKNGNFWTQRSSSNFGIQLLTPNWNNTCTQLFSTCAYASVVQSFPNIPTSHAILLHKITLTVCKITINQTKVFLFIRHRRTEPRFTADNQIYTQDLPQIPSFSTFLRLSVFCLLFFLMFPEIFPKKTGKSSIFVSQLLESSFQKMVQNTHL